MVADTPELFAQKVIQLLKDKEFRENMASSARELVEKKYDWSLVVSQFDQVYEDALKGKK